MKMKVYLKKMCLNITQMQGQGTYSTAINNIIKKEVIFHIYYHQT